MSLICRLQTKSFRHLDCLDALRGIAILGVILLHAANFSKQQGLFFEIGFTGQRGVQLFYMVSAFTLFLSLDSGRAEKFEWSNFFIRRFFRIAPLFYLAILGNLLLNGRVLSLNPYSELSRLDILSGFLFLNGLSPRAINTVAIGGWSIAVESSFYLCVPFLFLRVKTLGRAIALFVISAMTSAILSFWLSRKAANASLQQYFAFLWFPIEFPVFVLGIVAYIVWKQYVIPTHLPGNKPELEGQKSELSILLMVASAILYVANLPFNDRGLYFSSFLFLPLILGLTLYPWELLVNRFTKFMGKISYSVYLCHFFVLRLVENMLTRLDRGPSHFVTTYLTGKPLGMVSVFLSVVVISIPICMLTWRFVEQPGIRVGKRWIKRREESASILCTQGIGRQQGAS